MELGELSEPHVKFKTGRNLPPVLKVVTHSAYTPRYLSLYENFFNLFPSLVLLLPFCIDVLLYVQAF